ncbi:MAG: hypothetical protein ACXWWA_01455 [Chitinophagaceae bacterium]
MKKIVVCSVVVFILCACANTTEEGRNDTHVDTAVIGSDNPAPVPDTIILDSNRDGIINK